MATGPTPLWLWQDGTSYSDWIETGVVGPDGSSVLAGWTWGSWSGTLAGDRDQAVVKLDADGAELWRYQNGGAGYDSVEAMVMDQKDGSVILAGAVDAGVTDYDFSITKLDTDGLLLWEYEDGTTEADEVRAVPMTADGSVIAVGQTAGVWDGANAGLDDFAALRLDASGEEVWRYQDGTADEDALWDAVMVDADTSVIAVGHTQGSFDGVFAGGAVDIVVVKLDAATGVETWRYQAGTATGADYFKALAATADGGVVVNGDTDGNWSGVSAGDKDFVAVKLSAEGEEVWRWQDGTAAEDRLRGVVVQADGSIIFSGYTAGDWDGINAGGWDFMMVALSADGEELWRWQDGSAGNDWCNAMSPGSDGTMLLAGETDGSWAETNTADDGGDFVAMKLEMPALATPAPSAAPTPAPTFISPAPTLAPSAMVEPTSKPVTTPPASSPAPVFGTVSPAPIATVSPVSTPAPAELGTSERAAPVGAIVGGTVGGVLALGGLVLLALFKTGRLQRGKSPKSAAAAGSTGAAGSAGPSAEEAQHSTIPAPTSVPNQYPTKPQYPEPV